MTLRRVATWVLIGTAVMPVALYLVLPPLSRSAAWRARVQGMLASSGYDVAFATMEIGYDLSLTIGEMSVAAPHQPPFLHARQVEIPLSPWVLFTGRVASMRVDEPHVFVDHLPATPASREATALPFLALQAVDGFVHHTTTQGEVAIGPLSLQIDAASAGPTLAMRGRSEMALATLAQQLQFPGIQDGVLEASVELSGPLAEPQGSGFLQVRGLRWQHDSDAVSGDVEVPFAVRGTTVNFGTPGQATGLFAGTVGEFAWQLPQVEVSGTLEKAGNRLRGTAEIVLAEVEFHDAEHVRAGERLRVRGRIGLTLDSTGPPTLHVNLGVAEGEVLWDRAYADLKRHHPTIHGDLRPGPQGMLLRDVVLEADGIGKVTMNGSVDLNRQRSTVRARIDVDALNQAYALVIRDPLQEAHPFLARTDVGGTLTADLEYRGSERDWSVTGTIRLADGHAVATDPTLELRGLNADLPITLGTRPLGATPRAGFLRFAALRFGAVEISDTRVELSVVPNVVRLGTPLSLPVLGGAFVLNELEASHFHDLRPQMNLSFTLRAIDLEQLSRAMGWPRLHGTMGGDVPAVRLGDGKIHSDGEIEAQVFGGRIRVHNFRVKQIDSSVPTVELDLDFQDLLLAQLTETLEAGTISGVARGAVHHLAIAHGEPVRFDAWMETVPRRGVAQRISVKAIRQIAILGGGGDPLSQGVLSFFDEYRYARMGFRCTLENDRFYLRGIEQDGEKEYLVVGSILPPRVNVISHTPAISFSEMVRRLSRLRSERTSETEGGE